MRINELWRYYERDKVMQKYSPITMKAYKIQIRLLSDYLGNPEIGDVTHDQLKEYFFSCSHLKPSSLCLRMRFARGFFGWAREEGFNDKNPSLKIKEPKMGERVPKFLSEDDVETLRAGCVSPMEHGIIEFMYTTGCRVGEVVATNIQDIDWKKQSLIVHGKGDKDREVYFNTKCKIWLKKYLESRRDKDPAMFVTERAPRRMSISQMRYIVKRVAKRAGVEANVYPHRLRHSYATHLLENGAPIEAIQHLMGHQKSETTAIYCKLSGERRREIYKRYF